MDRICHLPYAAHIILNFFISLKKKIICISYGCLSCVVHNVHIVIVCYRVNSVLWSLDLLCSFLFCSFISFFFISSPVSHFCCSFSIHFYRIFNTFSVEYPLLYFSPPFPGASFLFRSVGYFVVFFSFGIYESLLFYNFPNVNQPFACDSFGFIVLVWSIFLHCIWIRGLCFCHCIGCLYVMLCCLCDCSDDIGDSYFKNHRR